MVEKSYFGCFVKQRIDEDTIPFFVFYARVKELADWAGIKRSKDYSDGTQRVWRESRSHAIAKKFLKSDGKNTIPNNILIAFEPGLTTFLPLSTELNKCIPNLTLYNGCDSQLDWGILKFSYQQGTPDHERVAMVVDGQHRLYGMVEFESEDLPVLVVSLLDATPQEQAFQFIVINSKAIKVPTDNVKSIIANLTSKDEQELEERLLEAGISYADKSPALREINDSTKSPFKNLLDWDYNREGKRIVPLAAIEVCLKYIKTQFSFFEEDEDSLIDFFCAIWNAAYKSYPTVWSEANQFLTKVNLTALNEFVVDSLLYPFRRKTLNVYAQEDVEKEVLANLADIPEAYWTSSWTDTIKIQDNSNVRKIIKDDLSKIAENVVENEKWYKDLKLPMINDEI